MSTALNRQAQQFYRVMSELLRRYQFRDREEICCHGISVSQCYSLDLLDTEGPLPTGTLAERLQLEISSVTRAVDGLVTAQLVAREPDPRDRRVRRVIITDRGRTLVSTIRGELVKEYEHILHEVPPSSRNDVIKAMTSLLTAFERRCCSTNDSRTGEEA